MESRKTETLIIGAGPAGLAAAMELSKAGKDFIVIEKDSTVGGLSKTYIFKEGDLEFRTDNGPHRFFSKNPYLYSFIEDLLSEQWIEVQRQTRQFIDGKFYDYPINFVQALRNVGLFKAFRMGFDYVLAKVRYGLFRKKIENFADHVYSNFGKTLGEFSMINYTEKVWGIPAVKLHPDWAMQRIKGLSVFSLVADALSRMFKVHNKVKPKSLVDSFFYPEYGTGLIYETIEKRLRQKGYEIHLNAEPLSVIHRGNHIEKVLVKTKEGVLEIACDNLIESVPLTHFITLFSPSLPKEVLTAGTHLKHRSQVYLFLTLDKDHVTADQWIYFPSKDIPVGRVSEMKNFSKKMSPPGKTSLFIEFFCFEGDAFWNMDDEGIFKETLPLFEKIGFFNKSEVRKWYVIRKKNVYPIYDLPYLEYLGRVKKELDKFENLYYIGRPGRFRYNNQDHSLEMGILAAQSIITGVRKDIEKVGEEKEYYESGSLPQKETHATS